MQTARVAVAGLLAMGLWQPSLTYASTYWGLGVRTSTISVCFVGDALSSRPDRVEQVIAELSEFEQIANIRFQHLGTCPAPVAQADGTDMHDGDIRVVLPDTTGTKLASWAGAEGTGPIPGAGCQAFVEAGVYNGGNDGWGSWSSAPDDLEPNRACLYNLKLGNDPWNDVPYRNHLLHEFGHALGLSHEHVRSDVDNVACPDLGAPTFGGGFMTGYDRDSVMHYQFLGCGIDGNYGRTGLSARDRLGLHILYPEQEPVVEFAGRTVIAATEPLSLVSSWLLRGANMSFAAPTFVWTVAGTTYNGPTLSVSLPVGTHGLFVTQTDFLGRTASWTGSVQVFSPQQHAGRLAGALAGSN